MNGIPHLAVSIEVLSLVHSTISAQTTVCTAETLNNPAEREKCVCVCVCVCMNEKESQMEKSEQPLIFPLSVAKETNQRCPHSRLQVTPDVQEMAAKGQRS